MAKSRTFKKCLKTEWLNWLKTKEILGIGGHRLVASLLVR
jgi:hypothetical protein